MKLTMSSSDSSFSSFFSSAAGAASAAAAAPPAAAAGAPAAGAPPPEPTFDNKSFTFLPSRAFANKDAQMGSTSTPAAPVRVTILSACQAKIAIRVRSVTHKTPVGRTVISIPSSARMRAAYVVASSAEAWKYMSAITYHPCCRDAIHRIPRAKRISDVDGGIERVDINHTHHWILS